VALLVTLRALLILFRAIFDLMVRTAAAVAQFAGSAFCDCVTGLPAIKATLLALRAFLIALLLVSGAALFCDVALLTALLTSLVLLGALLAIVISAATAVAELW